ncbi:hypothetical protein LTR95_010933 [Oleoguttula sp. CCFEE 5521]
MATTSTGSSTTCTLMDKVPPEIRERIFSYLLVRDQPIEFIHLFTKEARAFEQAKWVIDTHYTDSWTALRVVDKTKTRWTAASRFAAILVTCKLFAREAGEVLYGKNNFRFDTSKAAWSFLGGLGRWRAAITEVIVNKLDNHKKDLFLALSPLVNLRSLILPHTAFCTASRSVLSFRILKGALLPFPVALRTSYTQQGIRTDPMDILESGAEPCGRCRCGNLCMGAMSWSRRALPHVCGQAAGSLRESQDAAQRGFSGSEDTAEPIRENMGRPSRKQAKPPRAAPLPPTKPCIFTDRAPPEIRKEIFSYVLVKQFPIRLAAIRPAGKGSTRYVASSYQRSSKHRGETYDRSTKTWVQTPLIFTAILQTCKQLSAEATEVFHACNVFEFESSSAVANFLGSFEGPKHAIRYIDVGAVTVSKAAKPFWDNLAPLVNLRALTVSHANVCPKSRTSKAIQLSALQRDLRPLLKTLKDSYEQQGITASPANVLKIRKGWGCSGCNCICGSTPCGGDCRWGNGRLERDFEAAFAGGHEALISTVRAALEETVAGLDG